MRSLLLFSVLLASACADTTTTDTPEVGRPTGKADDAAAIPSGSYAASDVPQSGMIAVLEISDTSYRRLLVDGNGEEEGLLQYDTNEWSEPLVTFLDEHGYPRDTFQVAASHDELVLLQPATTQHFTRLATVSCESMGGVCAWSSPATPSSCADELGTEPVAGLCGDYSLICCSSP